MKCQWFAVALSFIASASALAQERAPGSSAIEAIVAPPRIDSEPGENETRERERSSSWETDRDSFTPSTKTVEAGRWILESAYSFIDNRRTKERHSFPEFIARYGLGERVELRLGWNYEVGGGSSSISANAGGESFFPDGLARESEISYGLKLAVTEQSRWRPESALIIAAFTPTSGEETATQLVLTYVFGWEFANEWKLDSSIRFSADSERGDRFEDWAPSIVLKKSFREKWDAHIEYFSIFTRNKEQDRSVHYISPGLHYLLNEDTEIGVRVGWGLNDQSADFFVNAGIGLRF
jgi:hypothetical protein